MQYSTAECRIYFLLTTYLQKQHGWNHAFSLYGQSHKNAWHYDIFYKTHFDRVYAILIKLFWSYEQIFFCLLNMLYACSGLIKSYSPTSRTSDFWGRTSKNLPFSSPRTTGFFQSTCPKLLSLRCHKVLFPVNSYYLLPGNPDVWSPSWLSADCFAEGKLDTCFLKTLHISVQPVFILLFCY